MTGPAPVLVPVLAALAGAGVGHLVDRAAARFPWPRPATVGAVLGGRGGAAPRGLLEAATAALFLLAALRFGPTAELPAWLWFVAAGVLLSVIDLREQLLPNRVLLPAVAGALVLLTVAAAAGDRWDDLLRAVLAGAAGYGVLLALVLISPSGMGMGDVKLAGLLGLLLGWLGWAVVLVGFLLGFLFQAVLGLALMAAGRAGRRTELPFGPALAAGALAAAVLAGTWQGLL
ncbi:prepilin peptidase [Geodermatophilus nigrescens]|uniref:Leader peptidase (Prepilin peptidase) / N-methyltransferase n=1 Tax=Geodermatophilus nigrescens TaxID=1070870 RepID=A0A1M5QQ38_9ACTN|nr:prepilin peptidase [Geodermatophilus nigrescens]SHH15961.1 leader peptidase (prepilin peptidase) / N-methyltransferase [Geodermatophilus nigrescens]